MELIRSVLIGILLGFMIQALKDRFGKWWFGVLVLPSFKYYCKRHRLFNLINKSKSQV